MIDTDKYEGYTEGAWTANQPAFATEDVGWRVYVGEHEKRAEVRNCAFNHDKLSEADARLIADAPLLLAELKRMYEFRDRVLAAFVQMSENSRSLTELLNWLGYCNYYSHDGYLMGLHPHALGLYELKDEWMEKAQQYLESERNE